MAVDRRGCCLDDLDAVRDAEVMGGGGDLAGEG
jgi:hypothetical protein